MGYPPDCFHACGCSVSRLERCYQFSEPSGGFLLGFAGVPTHLVQPAIRAFTAALSEAATAHTGGMP